MAHSQLSDIDVHVPKISRFQIIQLRLVNCQPNTRSVTEFILQRIEDLIE